MKLIRNRTRRPLRIPLGGDRLLHLGPGRTGQVSDDTVERTSFQNLLASGAIELLGDGTAEVFEGDVSPAPHEATRGHHPPTVVTPKGNR